MIEALRARQPVRYHAFDWQAFDGRLEATPTRIEPRDVILFEGVYTARPELADLVDLRVLVHVGDPTRIERLVAREGGIGPWESQWHAAEAWYFAHVAPPALFDVCVHGR